MPDSLIDRVERLRLSLEALIAYVEESMVVRSPVLSKAELEAEIASRVEAGTSPGRPLVADPSASTLRKRRQRASRE